MALIEDIYDAAARSGLLVSARFGGMEILVDYRAPDEDVLDGLGISRHHAIRYPASRLTLASGDTLDMAGHRYRVREVVATGDGSEARATLTRL